MTAAPTETIACPACDQLQPFESHTNLDIDQQPELLDEIVAGDFRRLVCTRCAAEFAVEGELLYTDLGRGWFIGVFPEARRSEALVLGQMIDALVDELLGQLPAVHRERLSGLRRRVVFGLDELREKALCSVHDIDDHALEALKLSLILRSPRMRRIAEPTLLLVDVDERAGDLVLGHLLPGQVRPQVIAIPRGVYTRSVDQRESWSTLYPLLVSQAYVHFSQCRPPTADG